MDRYKAPRDKLLCLVNVKTMVENIVGLAAKAGAAIGGERRKPGRLSSAGCSAVRQSVLCMWRGHTVPSHLVCLPPAGADAFFPVFLYIVIRSRLPHLASNIE